MLTSLDHVLFAVRDLDAATAAYTRLLGREPSWRGSHPSQGSANTLFRLERSYLELIAPAGDGPTGDMLRERLDAQGEGLWGLAFGTDDADACAKTLRERGLPASDPVPGEGRDERSGALREWRNVYLPPAATRGVVVFAIEHRSPADALPVAEPTGGRGIVQAIDHVVIRSGDPEATIALYGQGLGLRLALDRTFEKRGVRLLFFRVGGVTVEVAAQAGAEPVDRPDEPWGVAWQVDDAAAARTRLTEAGFDVTETRSGNKPGTRVCTVKDGTCGVPTLMIGPEA
ncbi:MAG: VOC family protein [Deltaproteobacteria bacterium]|nr:VOC family protein [Deltaproteobacteria bacterium]MBW2415137.1 VOC family protein [Deltaproteobacteria bacterium]